MTDPTDSKNGTLPASTKNETASSASNATSSVSGGNTANSTIPASTKNAVEGDKGETGTYASSSNTYKVEPPQPQTQPTSDEEMANVPRSRQINTANVDLLRNAKPCDQGYSIAVIVKTRLGGFPIPGLTVDITGDKNSYSLVTRSITDGTGCSDEYIITPPPCVEDTKLVFEVSRREDSGEKLLKETVRLEIEDLDTYFASLKKRREHIVVSDNPPLNSLGSNLLFLTSVPIKKVENRICLIQDVANSEYDLDYHELLTDDAEAENSEEEVATGTDNRYEKGCYKRTWRSW